MDPELAREWGRAMGEEFWNKGTNIQEGPGINVARIMKNGRNFEYISGEDPVLGSIMVKPLIAGMQENVMAIAKHYILNNQETDRSGVNELIDEQTIMELYGPPFASAADANVAGYMCAYNRINGDWACNNKQTMKTMLKGYYNFTGFVVSDWGATHNTNETLQNGLDIEMPDSRFFNSKTIQTAIDQGVITMDDVDDRCHRILSSYFSLPEDKRVPGPCGGGICIEKNVSTPDHKTLAKKISSMSTILLKNENNLLPLDMTDKSTKFALIGVDAMTPYTGGSGSGGVGTNWHVSPVTAFTERGFNVTYVDGKDTAAAVAAAKAADVAIVFGSAHTGEGHDRTSLNLEGNVDEIIPLIGAAQSKTIVVMSVPGSILTDWRDSVPAILTNLMPGEQVGYAIADILFGVVAPQAKLPVTFPNKDNEQGMTAEQYPGVKTPLYTYQANYSEGQIVGYRWYDKHGVKPAFAFGHGLTYGSFSYSDLTMQGRKLSFTVKRTGSGCDTPQVYIAYPTADTDPKVPKKVLRYFQKTCEAETVIEYELTDADVSNWDVTSKQWKVTTGTYKLLVGSSSQDISLTGTFSV
jgi:beta-glucosidase